LEIALEHCTTLQLWIKDYKELLYLIFDTV
jgi:hypothetical protein